MQASTVLRNDPLLGGAENIRQLVADIPPRDPNLVPFRGVRRSAGKASPPLGLRHHRRISRL
jgi:hypothetical protein